jgi:collagenase-like PrtC family protease
VLYYNGDQKELHMCLTCMGRRLLFKLESLNKANCGGCPTCLWVVINDRDNESMDSVDGKHDCITIPNDRDNESMDYKYS